MSYYTKSVKFNGSNGQVSFILYPTTQKVALKVFHHMKGGYLMSSPSYYTTLQRIKNKIYSNLNYYQTHHNHHDDIAKLFEDIKSNYCKFLKKEG